MKKIYYGWVICAACFLEMFLTAGLTANTYASYQPYLISVVGLSNTQASLLATIRNLTGFLAMLGATAFFGRLNLRLGMTVSVSICVLSYLVYSVADGFGVCAVAAALAGVGSALGGAVSLAHLLSRWFKDRMGLAMGLSTAGSGISSILASPLIEKSIHRFSLSATYRGQALVMLVLGTVVFLLVRNDPRSMGQKPYQSGKKEEKPRAEVPAEAGVDRLGLTVAMISIFLLGGAAAAFAHYSVLYISVGMDSAKVASMLAIGGFALTVGKLVYGAVVDSVGIARSNFIFFGLTIIGFAISCFARSATVFSMYISYGVLNFGLPLTTMGQSLWARMLSSPEDYPKNLNRFQSIYLAGSMVSGVVPGMVADLTGSYVPAFVLFTVTTALCFGGIVFACDRKKRGFRREDNAADV